MLENTKDRGLAIGLAIMMSIGLLASALLPMAHNAAGAAPAARPVQAGEDGIRDQLTVTLVTAAGLTQTLYTASGDGHEFVNNGDTVVVVANNYTDTITITFVTTLQRDGLDVADQIQSLAAGTTKVFGKFLPGVYNQKSGTDKGEVYINWDSSVTGTVANSVTLAGFKIR